MSGHLRALRWRFLEPLAAAALLRAPLETGPLLDARDSRVFDSLDRYVGSADWVLNFYYYPTNNNNNLQVS